MNGRGKLSKLRKKEKKENIKVKLKVKTRSTLNEE